jgi:hypothetical protein
LIVSKEFFYRLGYVQGYVQLGPHQPHYAGSRG